jgi:erythritol kinase
VSPLALGVDVGTTMAKAALFDLADPAEPVAVAEAPSPHTSPRPGHMEADPAMVLGAVAAGIAEVMREHTADSVAALGISATACGAWLVDPGAQPVRPAILWNDGRAGEIVAGWAADGRLDEVFAIAGNVPYPGYTLPLLAWLRAHEPGSLDAADAVLCPKDWLREQLTGVRGTDASDASYIPFDLRARTWSPELARLCGVEDDAARLLPPILPDERTDPLLPAWAERLGLPAGLPVGLGLTDVVSATVGGGAIRPGRAVTSLGTSAVSTVVADDPVFEPAGIGIAAAAPLGRFARTMVNTSGSMTLDWAARLVTGGDVGALLERAGRAPAGAEGLTLLPYLSPAGVVSPFVGPQARGALAGLRVEHGPDELARAAVEGLACSIADCYDAMPLPVERIDVVGGAARSDLLLQAIADATGVVVRRLAGEAFGARAVALLAARAAGELEDDDALVTAVEAVRTAGEVAPRPGKLTAARARYDAASRATRGLWETWE